MINDCFIHLPIFFKINTHINFVLNLTLLSKKQLNLCFILTHVKQKKNRLPIDNDIERIRQTFHIIKRQESFIDKNQSLDYPPKPSASQSRV